MSSKRLPPGTTPPRGFPNVDSIKWPLVPARELFELRYGRALVGRDRRPGSVPVYGTNGRCGSHDKALFEGPGVILGRKGQGPLGVEWCDGGYWVIDTAYSLTPLRSDVDLRYAYFLIKFIGLNHLKDGTSNPTLSRDTFGAQALPLPPLTAQRAIAHILGALDDKIELNRRMNETLEAMALAIFRSWFVDFDPVHAKAEGRDPGLPSPLADLFPDRFEDSDLGEIPKGWEVGKLGDILEQRVERCVASTDTATRPYVPIDCISSKSLFLTESKPGEEAQSSLTRFYKGDLLFGAMRPYFHKVCIAPFDGTTRTTAFVLFPRAKDDFAFATLLLHHPDTIDYATRHSTGSTIPYVVWSSSLEEMPVIVPPSEVRMAFDRVVRPILVRIPEPHFQNRTLAALRDALLPKLISGELRVHSRSDAFPKQSGHAESQQT